MLTSRYRNGETAKREADRRIIFLLPYTSERVPKGKLAKIPGTVDAAAIRPISGSVAPNFSAKKVSVGLLDIVELKIANRPMTERKINEIDGRCTCRFIVSSPLQVRFARIKR